MANFNVGPIIIMLLLLVAMFYFVLRVPRIKIKTLSSKKHPIFFMFYVSILMIALIVSLIVPNNKSDKLEEYEGDYDGEAYFYEVMNEERPIDDIAEFKQTEETYPMTGDQLDFSESNTNHYYRSINVLIVQDLSFTEEFKVETYVTPFIYEGKDISEFIEPVEVGGNDGVVHMHIPKKDTVLNMYDYSFPFLQFLDRSSALSGSSSYQIPSEQLTIVYIPENVTPNVAHITGDDIYYVEMITKE